jgi:coproporphyrinogen III oxidase-like Fe-S oxidoreductase
MIGRGPRYTSYPTAPVFKDSFAAEDYRREIVTTKAPGTETDFSLDFPFCDTLYYFCGCTGAARLLLRNVAICFDAYLDTMMKTKPIFSWTV